MAWGPGLAAGQAPEVGLVPAQAESEIASRPYTRGWPGKRIMRTPFGWALLALVAVVFLVGTLSGRARGNPRDPRVRLLAKPKRTRLTVLVPPGPTPRLIPSESPNATRARPVPAAAPRRMPGAGSGIIDYIAPFVSSGEARDTLRVDYLREPGDDESPDPPATRSE
jgi:hypothetical protein